MSFHYTHNTHVQLQYNHKIAREQKKKKNTNGPVRGRRQSDAMHVRNPLRRSQPIDCGLLQRDAHATARGMRGSTAQQLPTFDPNKCVCTVEELEVEPRLRDRDCGARALRASHSILCCGESAFPSGMRSAPRLESIIINIIVTSDET